MKKIVIAVGLLLCSYGYINAQQERPPRFEEEPMEMVAAPTVYEMTDEVRNAFGLDYDHFSKVYKAYEKYNKVIFGNNNYDGPDAQLPSGGRRGGGPGGMGGGMPGGGFGGGMPGGGFGGGMPGGGGPGGDMGGGMPGGGSFDRSGRPSRKADAPKPLSQKELEKRQKKIDKQEKELAKKIAKILNDESRYQQWLEIRAGQIARQFPAHRDLPPMPEELN